MANYKCAVLIVLACCCAGVLGRPKPVGAPTKDEAEEEKGKDDEYLRYMGQVMEILETDADFKKKLHNATEDDIRSGKIANNIDMLGHGVRTKLDELKRLEIEYQRQLQRQKKDHLNRHKEREIWNPLHHDNQVSFETEDFRKLLLKHHQIMEEIDKERKENFKEYELEKEHKRREHLKTLDDEHRKKEEDEYKHEREEQKKHHGKVHHPASKQQLQEVWEEEDNLDADSFDPKTFFKLHDKNGDDLLDMFELETLFLGDIGKVYNESDPTMDPRERDEELERMREHVMNEMDKDQDGFVSLQEFMMQTEDKKFEEDEDWAPLTDEDQFTPEELEEYEKKLSDREEQMGHHGVPEHHGSEKEHHEKENEEHHEKQNEEHHEEQKEEHHDDKEPKH